MPLSGGAASPSNTMWFGPRPTSIPSGILILPTVWPQYTNVTDRQDRQGPDSIGWTVLRSPKDRDAQKKQSSHKVSGVSPEVGPLSIISCLSVALSVTFVCCGQTVRWIKMPLGMEVGLGPGDIVLDGDPAPPPHRKGHWSLSLFGP